MELRLILVNASLARHSAASWGSSMCLIRSTASWFLITCTRKTQIRQLSCNVCVDLGSETKQKDCMVKQITWKIPVLAKMRNSVSESTFLVTVISSVLLFCFLLDSLLEWHACMCTFGMRIAPDVRQQISNSTKRLFSDDPSNESLCRRLCERR